MHRTFRPDIAAGAILLSAGLVAANSSATPVLDPAHRFVRLIDVEHGIVPFPEVDWNDLVANTTANWNGLTEMFDHTTALYSLPTAVFTEGLPQTLKDLYTELQALATYAAAVASNNGALDPTTPLPPLPDLFANPVLNPVSAVTLLLQNALASSFAQNAAQVGWTGIYQNMLPSINDANTQFTDISHEIFGGSGSFSAIQADFAAIGTDLTKIGNFLSLAPSTIINDYLNGYPVQAAAPDPLSGVVSGIGAAYTLNAPFTATGNVAITPEFGLLTNPFATITTNTSGFGDGTASTFLGTAPMQTGTLASLLQTEQTLADELLTQTSTIPGSGVTAPEPTGPLTVLGPDTLGFTLDLSKVPVIGDVISVINSTIIPFLNNVLVTTISTTNTVIDGVNSAVSGLSNTINTVVNPFISAVDAIISAINKIPGVDIDAINEVNVDIPHIPDISISIPSLDPINPIVQDTFHLPGIVEPGVPAYVMDIAQNQMSIIGSIAGIAAPVTGTVSSDGIGNFLAPDSVMNLGTLFDATVGSLFANTPITFTATLPLDWTNLIAEGLHGLFGAS